jgi:hypothetical protein
MTKDLVTNVMKKDEDKRNIIVGSHNEKQAEGVREMNKIKSSHYQCFHSVSDIKKYPFILPKNELLLFCGF